jgi:DNA-binding HxlR family transcriptional regulator
MSAPAGKRDIRSGAIALEILAAPLNLQILKGLENASLSVVELSQAIGSPPKSTMRIYLRTLGGVDTVSRARRSEFQGSAEYSITPAGRALLTVTEQLQAWLNSAPRGPIELGTLAARNAIRALADGWSAALVRALAGKTLSLTELDRLIPKLSYPALERRLTAMRMVGLIEANKQNGRSTPYRVTPWLQRAVLAITAASEWEREWIPDLAPPIGRLDIEAAFLLAIPMLELPTDLTGKVRLAVEVQRGASPVFAGVLLAVEGGEVISCTPGVGGDAEGWISGAPRSWLRRINLGEEDHLEVGGDGGAARAVLGALEGMAAQLGQSEDS